MNRLGAVIMAAGLSRRMGSENKLLKQVAGRRLFEYVIDLAANSAFAVSVVVTCYRPIAEYAAARGLTVVANPAAELGITASVQRGVTACRGRCGGYMFFNADQPFLRSATIYRLAQSFDGTNIVVPQVGGSRSSPVIFPADLTDELLALSGDTGGRTLFAKYRERLCEVKLLRQDEFKDFDRPEDFAAAAVGHSLEEAGGAYVYCK